jgi:GT2 family glycosyltransferase
VQGNFVPAQRELLVERALATNADVLVMCDDDMVLAPDAVTRLYARLVERPRCALAGALYYSRDGFRPMVVDEWEPSDTTSAVIPAFDDRTPVSVGGVGFGCVVVRVDAIRELAPPYFPAHVFMQRAAGTVRVCDEDYLFCHRLRSKGWDVVLDPGVRCGHFDRSTSRTMPLAWETPATTNRARMAVVVDGAPQLIAADRSLGRAPEHQVRAAIDYLIVD